MKSLNTDYFSRIDHLRFWAATLVIFHHFRGKLTLDWTGLDWTGLDWTGLVTNTIKSWLINGSSGVSLFLFLTGFLFCIISGYGEKKIRYTGFVYNRILRIFPLLVLMVFIVITVNRAASTPMDIFRILTLQLNTGQSYTGWGHDFYPTGPIWTIAVEFQFYLLFPFLALFLCRYGVRYLVILAILMVAIRFNIQTLAGSKSLYWNFYHTIIGRLDQFLIGMIFAVFYHRGYLGFLRSKILAIGVSLFSFVGFMYLFTFQKNSIFYTSFSFMLEAILWGMVVLSYVIVNINIPKFLDGLLSKLGEVSFSLYILHLPIGAMVNKLLELPVPTTVIESLFYSFLKFIVVILVSLVTFYAIEKPFMSLRVKYTS